MITKNEIIEIIFKSIEEINQLNNTHLAKNANALLFGSESDLDSLGLVNLITLIEEGIEELTDKYISISDERAFSLEESPFKTVETLANHIEILLHE